ncbi:MAG: mechanosensitive ion channel [Candidatus Omnitrophica bacterium]|nr:mechanosensitive ion channel [Candidatus Omnitrophota bacterium]MBD3268747.1 mechanosensitive ion channel [Candidatus Omnitrophota bacterium]
MFDLSSITIDSRLVANIATTFSLLVAVIVVKKIFNLAWSRWEKRVISRASRKKTVATESLKTKIAILHRIITAGIYFFALIFFLLQFEAVRNIGTGLLASAGVAGIVIGMAAQNTISNLIAGVSISFSQPVRLNDAVIFDNEFGWIEEISLMHTIIRTWDNRRIIVPNDILSSKVIQNWTMRDSSLLGIVMVYVDYKIDIEKIKRWVKEIVDGSSHSSREKVSVVQVVDFTEKTMVLRILAKGDDAPSTWNLRCEIREKLAEHFRKEEGIFPLIRIWDAKDEHPHPNN